MGTLYRLRGKLDIKKRLDACSFVRMYSHIHLNWCEQGMASALAIGSNTQEMVDGAVSSNDTSYMGSMLISFKSEKRPS